VTINTICKSYTVTDLASLYYVNFIEALVVSQSEARSFDSKQFTNTSINKLIQRKTKDFFLLFKEHFFMSTLVYRKSYDVQFEHQSNEDLEFFEEP
jgi:hypothetical protein